MEPIVQEFQALLRRSTDDQLWQRSIGRENVSFSSENSHQLKIKNIFSPNYKTLKFLIQQTPGKASQLRHKRDFFTYMFHLRKA